MKILFLDIDGVLNNDRSTYYPDKTLPYPLSVLDKKCIEFLNEIVERTKCKIVISSSWRHHGIPAIQKLFDQMQMPEIYDVTPDFFYKAPYYCRGDEIKEWLDQHTDVTHYCILDDNYIILDEQTEHFVLVDEAVGLTNEDKIKAIQILTK